MVASKNYNWRNSTETATTIYGFQQLIDEPSHICQNNSSCIDLIFTKSPNKGTHASLHETCQHWIIFAKARLRAEYPPSCKHHIWNYAKANVNAINKAISRFNWQGPFTNLLINEQVNLLNFTLMNNFSNFIPNKMVTSKGQDPLWFDEKIEAKIELKNTLHN